MIPEDLFVENLALAGSTGVDLGSCSVVECGVWRGGMSMAMMALLPTCPEFHLFDSFEGLPEPTAKDGQRAIDISQQNLFIAERNYARYDDLVREVDARGLSHRAQIHKGWFEETVDPTKIQRPIAVLRLDGDWYASTYLVLDRLFDRVVDNGLIIIDDYFVWPGCSRAVHDFLSNRGLAETIRTTPGGLAYLRKKTSGFSESPATEAELSRRRAEVDKYKAANGDGRT